MTTPYFGPSDHVALTDYLASGIPDFLWGRVEPGSEFAVLTTYTPPGERLGRITRITFELEQEVKDILVEVGPRKKRIRQVRIHWRARRAAAGGRSVPFNELDQIMSCGIALAVMGACRRFDTPDWHHIQVWTGRQLCADRTRLPDPWEPPTSAPIDINPPSEPAPAQPNVDHLRRDAPKVFYLPRGLNGA